MASPAWQLCYIACAKAQVMITKQTKGKRMKYVYRTNLFDETLGRFIQARDSGKVTLDGLTAWNAAKYRKVFVPNASLVREDGTPILTWDAEHPLPKNKDGDTDAYLMTAEESVPVVITWEKPIELSRFGCEAFAGCYLLHDAGYAFVMPQVPVKIAAVHVDGLLYPKQPIVETDVLWTSASFLPEVLNWVDAACPIEIYSQEVRNLANALARARH